jgi:hypothetical protein
MQTQLETLNIIGSNGIFRENGLAFKVRITDVRTCFGRTDYRITPDSGSGNRWVASDRVTIIGKDQ